MNGRWIFFRTPLEWLVLGAALVPAAGGEPPRPAGPASVAYVLQSDSLAKTKALAVEKLATCGADWLVLDSFFEADAPWQPADLEAIRRGKGGRQVVAYLSIGEAEDYRSYWRNEWVNKGVPSSKAPAWLVAANPEWKGNFKVRYWDAGWQSIMLASVEDAMGRGFDGVYLDIVDGFEFFEQDGRRFIDDRLNPETGRTFRRDMVEWVKAIAGRARAGNRSALVIPQNGAQLLAHPDFLSAIDAIGLEDLFTNGAKQASKADTSYRLDLLQPILETGKPVLVIEYPRTLEQIKFVKAEAARRGFVWLCTDRALRTLGESGR